MIHIASLYVQVRAQAFHAAVTQLEAMAGVELYASDPVGKLVVVLEADSSATVVSRMDEIRDIAGVVVVSLVFHGEEDTPQPDVQDETPWI